MKFLFARPVSPHFLAAIVAAASAAPFARPLHAQMLTSLAADATIINTGFADGGGAIESTTGDVGAGRNGTNYQAGVFVFQLPALGAVANPFTAASFSLTIRNTNSVDAFNGGLNRDLYGLGRRGSSTVLGSDYFLGGTDATDATLIQGGFITGNNTARFSGDVTRTTDTGGNINLAAYLNAQYAAGAGAGNYVFLRVNLNGTNGNLDALPIRSGEDGGAPPIISYTATVPEPSTWALAMVGLGALSIVCRRRLVRA